jgi:hypothetical protein
MRERPIVLKAREVRAILDGRMTQMRRIVKARRGGTITGPASEPFSAVEACGGGKRNLPSRIECAQCPYGVPGDQLWARETWARRGEMESAIYKADELAAIGAYGCVKWSPSINMPRWASRITLEVTAVRVERVQEISPNDARAEGLVSYPHEWRGCDYPVAPIAYEPYAGHKFRWSDPIQAYEALWEENNGAGSWAANPWVWVIEFRRTGQG